MFIVNEQNTLVFILLFTQPMHLKPSGPTLEKNPSRNLRHIQEKRKRTPIREKMASLEKLRNLQNSKFVLSRDAFQKIQKITSGGPYYLTKTKIRP